MKSKIQSTIISGEEIRDYKGRLHMTKEEIEKHTIKIPDIVNKCLICENIVSHKEFITIRPLDNWGNYLGICGSCLEILRNIIMKEK